MIFWKKFTIEIKIYDTKFLFKYWLNVIHFIKSRYFKDDLLGKQI